MLPTLVVNKISHVCTFCLYGLKDGNCSFIWCFSCFSWFSYCRGKCICAGQGNTIVSHFVVQRGDFTVAIACVPCGPRRSLIYAWAWGFWGCWKLSAAEKVKPDCCHMPAVVSIFDQLTSPASCPVLRTTRPLQLWRCESRMSGATWHHSRLSDHGPDHSRQPWWWWPATNTTNAGYHNWQPG